MLKNPRRRDLERYSQEHDHLTTRIAELREWISEVSELGIPHFAELGSRLRPLLEELNAHFEHEEQRGYLAGAIERVPQFIDDVDELLLQHSQFRNQLHALICRLGEYEPPFSSWQQACAEFEDVLAEIERHERRETSILKAACDAGTLEIE